MLSRLLAASAIVAWTSPALAHVQVGTYKGTDGTNSPCSLEVKETYYQDGLRHALNSRAKIVVGGSEFIVAYKRLIDTTAAVAKVDYDIFQGVLPITRGAKALEIRMEETADGHHGPTAFQIVEHLWAQETGTKSECLNLTFEPN